MRNFLTFDPKLLFYGFAIIFFANFGQTFFISIFNKEIRTLYNLTDGQFGLVYALGTLFSSLILVGFAKLIDYIDLRIYSFIISIGLTISCVGMYSNYQNIFFLFLIIFGLRFFGQGAMSHAGETTMARYFGSNRGKAISFANSGGQIGVMFLPLIVVILLKVMDWRHVWLASSFSIMIIFIPLLFLSLQDQAGRHLNFKQSNKSSNLDKKWKTRELIFDKNFYIYLPLTVAAPFIGTGLMFHQIFIINTKNWNLEMFASGYIFLGIFSLVGLVLGGPIIDKFRTKKLIVFTLLPLFLGILTLAFFKSYVSMFIYLSLLGFNMGIGSPFIGSLWAELYGLKSLGSVKALLHTCTVFASALSPVIFGYIIDLGMGIITFSIISIIIIIFSTILSIIYQNS